MIKINKLNRNIVLYFCSYFASNVSLGMFLLVFNLHINNIISSKTFLSNFLVIGNLSMAFGGLLFGRVIDNYSKKIVLLLAASFSALFFILESFLCNEVMLYFVSLFYGLSYSLLMSIHAPFIMQYSSKDQQPYIFSIATSVRLLGVSIGSISGGYIANFNLFGFKDKYLSGLFLASVIFVISVIPIIFIERLAPYKKGITDIDASEDLRHKNHTLKEKILFYKGDIFKLTILAFIGFVMGLLIFFYPYMNLYLEKKYSLNVINIGIFLSLINVLPIVSNILLTKLFKHFDKNLIITCGLILCVISYFSLAVVNNIWFQIIIIIVASISASFVSPIISNEIMLKFKEENHGKVSGFLNFWYNTGDTVGTYFEGIFIGYMMYFYSFIAAAILYIILAVLVIKLDKAKI